MIFSRIFATSTPLFKSFGMFVVFFFCLNIQQVFVRAGPRIVIQQNNHPDTENEISHRIPSAAPSMKTSSMLRHSTPAWRDIQNRNEIPVDLLFLIDGSSSIGQRSRNDFDLLKDWVFDMANGFDIENENVRIAVVQYSHWQPHLRLNNQPYIKTEISFDSCNDFDCLRTELDKIRQFGFTTYTGAAINKTVNFDFATSRRETNKVLVLVTDASSVDDVTFASAFARSQNIEIFSVGVGSYNLSELQIISNGQVHNNWKVYTEESFENLSQIVDDLQNEIKAIYNIPACPRLETPLRGTLQCTRANEVGSECTLTCHRHIELTVQGNSVRTCLIDHQNGSRTYWSGVPSTCGVCMGQFDLLVLLDLSSGIHEFDFRIVKDFVLKIVDTFHISSDTVRVSLIHHDSSVVRMWGYDLYLDNHALLTEILNIPRMNERTKAGIPLWEALDRNFRTGSGKRLSSPHITLMLTDGSSTDSLLQMTDQLHLVSKVIAVGIENATPMAVSQITFQPSERFFFTYKAPELQNLLEAIDNVVRKICLAQSEVVGTSCDWSQISNSTSCGINLSCTNSNRAGSVCSAICCPGYEIPFNSTTTCNYDGTWSKTSFHCQEKVCPNLPSSRGLRKHCTEECNVTSVCSLSCEDGYIISGRSSNSSCPNDRLECFTTCERREFESEPSWSDPSLFTCIEIPECQSNPCLNNGTCIDLVNGFNCSCAAGFSGSRCEEEVNMCLPNPCHHNSSCIDGVDDFECLCAEGLSGKICDVNIDDCISGPCLNGGNCSDEINDYSCSCPAGYEGKNCDRETDWCATGPCQNGGTCVNSAGTYVCRCLNGFTGINCTEKTRRCDEFSCSQHGTCHDHESGFTCDCSVGFSGETCNLDIDDCASNPCENGNCTDLVDGYECSCHIGYTGRVCDSNIDDCEEVVCQNGGSCLDGVASFHCDCMPGYGGEFCDVIDDYCLLGADTKCNNNGTCQSQSDGFICVCEPGFSGARCEDEILCSDDLLSRESPPRSHCSRNGSSVGTICTLSCRMGSRPKNSNLNRTCLASGSWSVSDMDWGCDEIMNCIKEKLTENLIGRLTSVSGTLPLNSNFAAEDETGQRGNPFNRSNRMHHLNGKVSADCPDEDVVGAKCRLRCDPSYRLVGSDTSECLSNGSWSYVNATCVRTICPALNYPDVTCTNGTNFDSICTRSCPAGFRILGSNTKRCNRYFEWYPANTWECSAYCPSNPPAIENGLYDCTRENLNGSVCHSRCSEGYVVTQKARFACVFNAENRAAQWIGLPGSCEPVNCQQSINFTSGQAANFTNESAVSIQRAPYLPPKNQTGKCHYKAVASLHFTTTTAVIFDLWYETSPSGQHFQICSSEYNVTITGLDDKLLQESESSIINNTHANIFNANDHIRVRIEPQSVNFYHHRLNQNINIGLSNYHSRWNLSFNGGAHRFSNNTLYFGNSEIDSGLCLVCVHSVGASTNENT